MIIAESIRLKNLKRDELTVLVELFMYAYNIIENNHKNAEFENKEHLYNVLMQMAQLHPLYLKYGFQIRQSTRFKFNVTLTIGQAAALVTLIKISNCTDNYTYTICKDFESRIDAQLVNKYTIKNK